MDVRLGIEVRDKITGLSGTVTGFVQYIGGGMQLFIQPPADEDGYQDGHWFDVERIEVLNATPIVLDHRKTPGCDQPAPVR